MSNRVMFIGSKELGLLVLKTIYNICPKSLIACITIDDSKDIRTRIDCFRLFCDKNDIPLSVLSENYDLSEYISKYYPDLCFVVGWYYLIDSVVINSVKGGFIGIHCSLLPKYRGFAPVVWQMINGESDVGISFFSLSEEMDAGDIWLTDIVEVYDSDYISDVLNKISAKVKYILQNNYNKILNGNITPHRQQLSGISYCAKRIPDDGYINWKQGARQIYNFVRAQSHPYPGAFTYLNGEKIMIWECSIYDYPVYGMPGQVVMVYKNGVVVSCGENEGILLTQVEYNKELVFARNLVNSLNIRFY